MPEIDLMKAGICLSFLGGVFLLFFVVWLLHRQDSRPAYKKRLPKVIYGDEVRETLALCYTTAKDIEGMLFLAGKHCRVKKARMRFRAARSYLLTSRYKDYETALFVYASDGTKTQKEFFKKIIQAEASRYRRLPKKEDGM